ncbi:unnamed protein product [Chrysodeixis includens]|uniref:Odorant receptor n=1 Tax=Chrysodeixis includens TaxID=689277 RepID=A0A9P0C3K2_CHRIL|nr:unnamed protein product [Chrysodeixis includens]
MKALQQFPEDFSQPYIISFEFMRRFNVRYLEDDQTFIRKYWQYSYIAPATLIQIITQGTHIALLLKRQDIMQFAAMLPPFLVTLHSLLKASVLIPQTAELSSFIKELGTLWRTKFTESQSKLKNARLWRLNFCIRANYFVTTYGSLQYLILPLLETLVRRYILQQDCELLLPIAASYPFDPTKNWVIYIPVYIFQFYTMFLLIYIYMGSELILISSCALLGIEFLMLKDDLSKIQPNISPANESDDGMPKPTIREFVIRHQHLIRLSQQLDNVFNRMIFIDLLFVGITTCAFSFAGEFARGPIYMLNNYVAVASSLTTVFYVCYYGEILMGASAEIGDQAYKRLWYKGDKHFAMAIWLIIKKSQTPCRITSLKYAFVSLNMFNKVVSTTWSYFSLMNSVYSED